MAQTKLRIGILGAGMIATVEYGVLPNLAPLADRIDVVAIASSDIHQAGDVAGRFGIPNVFASIDEMLTGVELDAVVNLSANSAHFETSMAVLRAGKHLVLEKPFVTTMEEANILSAAAAEADVVVVVAPHDMIANQWRTARQLVTDGAIGRPTFARVHSSHGGPALMGWPTDPTWFYQDKAGALLDIGIYGLHQITGILGPAQRVTALSGITAPTRHVRNGPFDGLEISVTEPDNTLLLLDFGNAVYASVDATYNAIASRAPALELYGSSGTLIVHGGEVGNIELFMMDAAPGIPGWITPTPVGFPEIDRARLLRRAVLIDHLLDCLDTMKYPTLSLDHARHVLEIMIAARQSAVGGVAVDLQTRFQIPSTESDRV